MLNFLEEDIENTFNIGFIAYAPKVQATRKKRGDKLDFTKTIFSPVKGTIILWACFPHFLSPGSNLVVAKDGPKAGLSHHSKPFPVCFWARARK